MFRSVLDRVVTRVLRRTGAFPRGGDASSIITQETFAAGGFAFDEKVSRASRKRRFPRLVFRTHVSLLSSIVSGRTCSDCFLAQFSLIRGAAI